MQEAIAGKAIVASAIAGIPEAIAGGQEGLLVPPTDAAALADALRWLIVDPARRTVLGQAAAERAKRDFTVTVMADRYEALYAKAVGEGHRGRYPSLPVTRSEPRRPSAFGFDSLRPRIPEADRPTALPDAHT